MQISCIAIDDEPLALEKIEGFIKKIPDLDLVKTFDNPVEAMGWLKDNKPGIIFLDIQMEPLSGIQFLESVAVNSRIIITSAYNEYAIKGYDLNVTDYLLKPFSFQRFVQSVKKAMDYISNSEGSKADKRENENFIFVKTEYRYEKVDLDEIIYIEGMKDYLRIICKSRKIMTLQSFSKIEELLPPRNFCRVHKSYIVAVDKIKSVERGVISISDVRIPVSNTYRDTFFARIGL
jgi:DNA-binding LytR/AlgR family response regulator